jgi:hypothetical protein
MDRYEFRIAMSTPSHDEICPKHQHCVSYKVRLRLDQRDNTCYTQMLCTKFRCPAATRPVEWDEPAEYREPDCSQSPNNRTNGNCLSYRLR